jgi:hypothetical protein
MTNKKETILLVDASTGIEIERELTEDELEERQSIAAESLAVKEAEEAKKAARNSALAKLAALGLTEEEIAAL